MVAQATKRGAITDDALRMLTGYRLQRASGAAMVRYKEVFAAHGLRRTTFSCLCLIVAHPGLRQSQLGETLAIERPNLGQIIDDLLKADLIERNTSLTDRRAYALTPTPTGKALFTKAMKAVRALDAEMTTGLNPEDTTALQEALGTIEQNALKQP